MGVKTSKEYSDDADNSQSAARLPGSGGIQSTLEAVTGGDDGGPLSDLNLRDKQIDLINDIVVRGEVDDDSLATLKENIGRLAETGALTDNDLSKLEVNNTLDREYLESVVEDSDNYDSVAELEDDMGIDIDQIEEEVDTDVVAFETLSERVKQGEPISLQVNRDEDLGDGQARRMTARAALKANGIARRNAGAGEAARAEAQAADGTGFEELGGASEAEIQARTVERTNDNLLQEEFADVDDALNEMFRTSHEDDVEFVASRTDAGGQRADAEYLGAMVVDDLGQGGEFNGGSALHDKAGEQVKTVMEAFGNNWNEDAAAMHAAFQHVSADNENLNSVDYGFNVEFDVGGVEGYEYDRETNTVTFGEGAANELYSVGMGNVSPYTSGDSGSFTPGYVTAIGETFHDRDG